VIDNSLKRRVRAVHWIALTYAPESELRTSEPHPHVLYYITPRHSTKQRAAKILQCRSKDERLNSIARFDPSAQRMHVTFSSFHFNGIVFNVSVCLSVCLSVCRCSFNKHGLMLIVLGKQQQPAFKMICTPERWNSRHFYLLALLLNSCDGNNATPATWDSRRLIDT